MTTIERAGEKDAQLLSELAGQTFLESHGMSAARADIDAFKAATYSPVVLREELRDPANIYHIVYSDGRPAGYSKIILNMPYEGSPVTNITKLERIYILKEFYRDKLGSALFDFNTDLMKRSGQAGTWLYVWKENSRALAFYESKGFVINGSHDFRISATHVNPNHRMLLLF
jgi:ribosomal protein S18 acetylase RimI-like enzyme